MKPVHRRGAVGVGEWEMGEAPVAAAGMALCSLIPADTGSRSLPSSGRFLMHLGIKSCIILFLGLPETAPKEDVFHCFKW